jgi:hypothetical protein
MLAASAFNGVASMPIANSPAPAILPIAILVMATSSSRRPIVTNAIVRTGTVEYGLPELS